jgi:hypothetical protein
MTTSLEPEDHRLVTPATAKPSLTEVLRKIECDHCGFANFGLSTG